MLTFLPPEAPKLAWLGLMEEGSGQQGLTQPKCPRAGRSTARAATLVLAGGGGGWALCWLDLDPPWSRAWVQTRERPRAQTVEVTWRTPSFGTKLAAASAGSQATSPAKLVAPGASWGAKEQRHLCVMGRGAAGWRRGGNAPTSFLAFLSFLFIC